MFYIVIMYCLFFVKSVQLQHFTCIVGGVCNDMMLYHTGYLLSHSDSGFHCRFHISNTASELYGDQIGNLQGFRICRFLSKFSRVTLPALQAASAAIMPHTSPYTSKIPTAWFTVAPSCYRELLHPVYLLMIAIFSPLIARLVL